MADRLKTKSGRVLSDADIDRLATRAEQGFELSRWQPRRGRPSLNPSRAGQSPRVAARVSEDVYRRAAARAAAEGKSMSQVVRDLLGAYVTDRPASRRAARGRSR